MYKTGGCLRLVQRGDHFSQTSRVVLPSRQPGGWSARGQPCDAIHAVLRRYMAFYAESTLGYRSSLIERASKAPLLLSNGNPYHQVSHEDAVLAAIYGWRRLSKSHKVLRWAWLSRGMASKEEMMEVNAGIDLTSEELTAEMKKCELDATAQEWDTPLDEVWMQPDVQRTCFIWQMKMDGEDETAEQWEREDDEWRCLPSHWQLILNRKLSEFHSKIQDADILYAHRKDVFGEADIKTKNAASKLKSLQEGKGSDFIILICKGSGKEASQDVYNKSLNKTKGTLKASTSKHVSAYNLSILKMTLQLHSDAASGEIHAPKSLRVLSVTGRSREVQELRLHLDALSLSTSRVMEDLPGEKKKRPRQNKCEEDAEGLVSILHILYIYPPPSQTFPNYIHTE